MTSDADFLAEIRARPLVDDARLAYADWLEEQGDSRAEYLRTSVELMRGPHSSGAVDELTRTLRELAVTLDSEWRANAGVRVDVQFQALHSGIPLGRAIIAATGVRLRFAHRFMDGAEVTLCHGLLREALPDFLTHFTNLGVSETNGRVWVIRDDDHQPVCRLLTKRAAKKQSSGWPRRATYGDGHPVRAEVTDVPVNVRGRVARVMAAVSKRPLEEIAADLASGRCIVTEGIDDLAKTFSRNFGPPLFVNGRFMYGHVCSVTYQSPAPEGSLDV